MNPQLSRHWNAQTSAIALASVACLIGCGSKVSIGTQSVGQPSPLDGSAQAGDEIGNNHAPSAPDAGESDVPSGVAGTGGAVGNGGSSVAVGTGGVIATGGLTTTSGWGGSNGSAGADAASATSFGGAGGVGGIGEFDAPGSGGVNGTGGATGSGGAPETGGATGSGGAPGNGGMTGAGGTAGLGGATGTGGSTGSGGATSPVTGPCDIYAAATPATPCVAAYSMVRVLRSAYSGPLYQVRKGGSSRGTGGTTTDIGFVEGGFADAAAQDTACAGGVCTVSILYDHSGNGNHLKVAPAGCSTGSSTGTALEPDFESNATGRSLMVSGHKVYALSTKAHDGYRNNTTSAMPAGSAEQGVYAVADGVKNFGTACCWDFGNASTDNCWSSMNALFFGTGYWGMGAINGPYFMGDLGVGTLWPDDSQWACGAIGCSDYPLSKFEFAFGVLKTGPQRGTIRVASAQSGGLTTAYDGALAKTLQMKGGIVLGISGDNSNSSSGTFFEGAITAGRPADAIDAAILKNVQAAGYGK
jgi:hypothetical protein